MRKFLMIVAAVFVATATVALAGSLDQGRRLAGPFCVSAKTGVVRSIALTASCKAGELRKVGLAVPTVVGPKGDTGATGSTGATGATGAPGDSYLKGAYYSVAYYDVGDTNAGAIATVACQAQTDTAISGGVQVLGLDEGANSRNTPVSSSFPGRMDWSTNTPKADRLDGWIIQFGGNAGAVSDKDPLKVKVWALCVPNLTVPVIQTYTQSS